jgi:hypothetical protein
MVRFRTAAAMAALLIGATAATATLDSIDIGRDGGVYSLYAETFLDASPASIASVLLDYERFGRISSVYKEYGYLDPLPDGTPVVFTRMEGCLLKVFCKSMTRVERLEVAEPGHIRTVTLPERSDFKRSISDWSLLPEADGTRLTYSLEMEPDFFVPPVVGPLMLKRTLRRGGGRAIERIERLAQAVDTGEVIDAVEARDVDAALEQGI